MLVVEENNCYLFTGSSWVIFASDAGPLVDQIKNMRIMHIRLPLQESTPLSFKEKMTPRDVLPRIGKYIGGQRSLAEDAGAIVKVELVLVFQ